MGRAKEVLLYNNRYKGSLTEKQCQILDSILEMDRTNGHYTDFKHLIKKLSDSDVYSLIDYVEQNGVMPPKEVTDKYEQGTLRDMQTTGVAFMYVSKRCLNGDSVGLGKTVQASALAELVKRDYARNGKPFRYLYLTEKSLVQQTRHELIKFTGDYVYLLLEGSKKYVNKYLNSGFTTEYSLVGTHSLLTNEQFLAWFKSYIDLNKKPPFDMIFVDESAIISNLSARITKNANELFKYFERVVFLNATPFGTKVDTFYAQLYLLDNDLLPPKTRFQKEYCEMDYRWSYPRPTGNYKKGKGEQFRQLVGYRYIARTRKENGAVMEDSTGELVVSPLSTLQKEWLPKTSMNQMIFDCPQAINPDIEYTLVNVPKLRSLYTILREKCYNSDTVLIYVHYREAQIALSEWLTYNGYSNGVLCGETKPKERERIIRGFKEKEFQILITNVQKGLNFGFCDHCIFYSFNPNPAKMVQFEGRITRSFDIIGKHVYLLVSEGAELDRLNTVIKNRAVASSEFTQSDLSCVMSLLLEKE